MTHRRAQADFTFLITPVPSSSKRIRSLSPELPEHLAHTGDLARAASSRLSARDHTLTQFLQFTTCAACQQALGPVGLLKHLHLTMFYDIITMMSPVSPKIDGLGARSGTLIAIVEWPGRLGGRRMSPVSGLA